MSQPSTDLVSLPQAVWEDAILRATGFTLRLASKIPRHLTVADVVHTAVERTLSGTRSFDPNKYSLAAILCGTIRSILSGKGLAEFQDRLPLATDDQLAEAKAIAPDDGRLFSSQDLDQIMNHVLHLANGDGLFKDYVEAFRANYEADEIAELLSIPVGRCYELKRQLRHLTSRAVEELNITL